MATGICYTQSGGEKKYESDTGTDNSIYVRRLLENTYINNSISTGNLKNVTGLILTSFRIKDSTYIGDDFGIILSTPPYSSYISHYLTSESNGNNYENYYLKGHYEDTNESSYYTWEKIDESQISNISYALIIASYYPKLGLNPSYYKYTYVDNTGTYNINCRIWVTGDGHDISVCGQIESHDAQMPIPVYDLLRQDVINTHIKVYINNNSSVIIDFELTSLTWNGYETPNFKYTTNYGNYSVPNGCGIDGPGTKNKTITSTYNNCIYNVNYYTT